MFTRKRPAALAVGLVLATGVFAVIQPTVAVSASVTFTSTSFYVTQLITSTVPPTDSHSTEVMAADFSMQQGETRRVTDQLAVTLSTSDAAEIDNDLTCTEPGGQVFLATDGTNWADTGTPAETWSVTLLMTASQTGTAHCEVDAQTSDGHTSAYQETVVPSTPDDHTTGTWLKVSNYDEVGAQSWVYSQIYSYCNSDDHSNTCWYLGDIPGNPTSQDLFGSPYHQPEAFWTAASDATNVDVTGNFQVTSCPSGSRSCRPDEHGSDEWAKIYTYLEFDQLNPDGSVCDTTRDYGSTPGQSGGTYVIYNSVHHQPIYYHVSAPVSPNCGGSRQFLLTLHIEWLEGNPVKLDSGNFSAINSERATTTTVPDVTKGTDGTAVTEAQADSAIAAAGLAVNPTYVVSPAPHGTVLDQNSPAGTVEPTGSPVQITVSLGEATVPDVLSVDQSSAEQAITNAGLDVGAVSYTDSCVDTGTVQTQNPSAGVQLALGSTVDIQVSTCTSGGGGGGGGGIQPK